MEPTTPAPTTAGLRVLIADPWAEDWDEIMPLLTSAGIVVSLFATGEDALQAAKTQQPHLVLLEISMKVGGGKLDAMQVISKLREMYPGIRVELVSSITTGECWLNYERFTILSKWEPGEVMSGIEGTHIQDGGTAAGSEISAE